MPQRHDRLIAFLEHEAEFLRKRIARFRESQVSTGITGDGEPTRGEAIEHEAESKLAEIEAHIKELRSAA